MDKGVICARCRYVAESPECVEERSVCRSIIGALRQAVAPQVGVEKIAVARDILWARIENDYLGYLRGTKRGSIIYVFGQYGQGKTFFCNFVRDKAWRLWDKGFATSYVEVKRFEEFGDYVGLYRKIVRNIRFPQSNITGVRQIFDTFTCRASNKSELENLLSEYEVNDTVAKLVRFYFTGDERVKDAVIDWVRGEHQMRADKLHLIDRKGFQKIREDDVDAHLCGINSMIKGAGYVGLVVFFDEAEVRDRPYDPREIFGALRVVKYLHNRVNNDPRFTQLVFLVAGTLDLWTDRMVKDEALRQRIDPIWEQLNPLTENNYIDLYTKIIDAYDCCFQTNLSERVTRNDLKKWVHVVVNAKGGVIEMLTPRDFISQYPTSQTSFMEKLDVLRRDPSRTGNDVFV